MRPLSARATLEHEVRTMTLRRLTFPRLTFPRWHRNPEARLTTRLLSGKIGQAEYHEAMARLANHVPRPAVVVDTAIMVVPAGDDPRVQLARLGTRLPELSPKDLCAAFLLAQHGADADVLVEALNISPRQAAVIVGSFHS